MVVQLVVVNRGFQSTRLREARLRKAEHSFLDCCFNPRAYVRRDFTHITTVINYISFNPRAYVRRDLQLLDSNLLILVSIHAPT